MKSEQFSHRIGNIDDKLIQMAENTSGYGLRRQTRTVRRVLSIAAVIALMACSFVVGAFAFPKEPEAIYVEKEQEIITIGDSGITLILPDEWKGKYGYELHENNLTVYHLATRESFRESYGDEASGGDLFRVFCLNERFPMDYVFPYPGFTISITDTNTYVLSFPSDVQFNPEDSEATADYMKLSADVSDVEIVMSAEMLENTMNASNWVAGTVFVHFLEEYGEGGISETVVCDAEQSEMITQIVTTQDYGEPRSFYTDLWIVAGKNEYFLNSATRDIMIAAGGYSAALSPEDLQKIMSLWS